MCLSYQFRKKYYYLKTFKINICFRTVSTNSFSDMTRTSSSWLDQHASQTQLRPMIMNQLKVSCCSDSRIVNCFHCLISIICNVQSLNVALIRIQMHMEIGGENLLANPRLAQKHSTAGCILCYIISWPPILVEATQLLHHPGLEFWQVFHIKPP